MNLFRRRGDSDSVVIMDFGSQYTQLIARRIRELGVFSEIVSVDATWSEVSALRPRGLILSGGPSSVYDPGAPQLPDYVLASGIPVLGICYGMQLIGHALNGRIEPAASREYGPRIVRRVVADDLDPILRGLPDAFDVWMSHGDVVVEPPPRMKVLARSEDGQIA